MEKAWPFDGIMGFSQGAMLAAVVCGRGVRGGMRRPAVAIIAVGSSGSSGSSGGKGG